MRLIKSPGKYAASTKRHISNEKLPTLRQLDAERQRLKYKRRFGDSILSTVSILIVVAAIAVLLATLFFPVFRIYGSSMAPTINEGEILVALKGSSFQSGDVIVLSYNNKLLVKRVIAGPGQWVDIDKDGTVSVDGEEINEPYLQDKAYGDCTVSLPYQVPDGRYFVMGDNRSISQDSRSVLMGCIAEEQILGRAFFRVWPLNAIGSVIEKNQYERARSNGNE